MRVRPLSARGKSQVRWWLGGRTAPCPPCQRHDVPCKAGYSLGKTCVGGLFPGQSSVCGSGQAREWTGCWRRKRLERNSKAKVEGMRVNDATWVLVLWLAGQAGEGALVSADLMLPLVGGGRRKVAVGMPQVLAGSRNKYGMDGQQH